MVQINFARKAVTCKVVYYGPARSGKTANLRAVHARSPAGVRGQLTSMATDGQRTLYFDFLPLDLGEVAGVRTKVHLYSIPYLENQNALRMLVLEGADGIVFVADRSKERLEENREALVNLRDNLTQLGRELEDVPVVFQWNKSDLADALPLDVLQGEFNLAGRPAVEACAESGAGVLNTLKLVTHDVLEEITRLAFGRAPTRPARTHRAEPATKQSVSATRERPEGVPQPTRESIAAVASIGGGADGRERESITVPAWRRGADEEDEDAGKTGAPFFGVEPPKLTQTADFTLPPTDTPLVPVDDDPEPPAFGEEDPPTDPEPELHLQPAPAEGVPGWFDDDPGTAALEDEPGAEAGGADGADGVELEPYYPEPQPEPEPAVAAPAAASWRPPLRSEPEPGPHPRPAPVRPAPAPVGEDPWRGPAADARAGRDARPVVDRRRRVRVADVSLSDTAFWTGAALSLVSLIAIGYVVSAFL